MHMQQGSHFESFNKEEAKTPDEELIAALTHLHSAEEELAKRGKTIFGKLTSGNAQEDYNEALAEVRKARLHIERNKTDDSGKKDETIH